MMASLARVMKAFFFMMFFSFDIYVLFLFFMGLSALLMVRGRGISKGFIFLKKFFLFFGQPRRLSAQDPEGFVSPDDGPSDLLGPDRGHGVSQLILQEDVIEVVVLLHDLTPFPF